MNQTRQVLSNIWNHFQASLFPWPQEELGELTGKRQQLIELLEIAQIETHLAYVEQLPGHAHQNTGGRLPAPSSPRRSTTYQQHRCCWIN